MFSTGEYVVCGNKGVCVVEKITRLDISGVDKEREYYILKPLYQNGSTVYIPVDASGESIRPVLGKEEAEALIGRIPQLAPIEIANEKLSEQLYKDSMRANSCEEWVRVIKTIHVRSRRRLEAGRKMTAVDTRYIHMAEENLYGELAVALQLERGEVQEYIEKELDDAKNALQVPEKVLS